MRIKNLTHTFVNTMFYFRINASIVAFLSNHISFGILMTKPQVLGLKKSQVLGLKLNYSSLINTIYVLSAILLSCVLSRVVHANNVPPIAPEEVGQQAAKHHGYCLIPRVASLTVDCRGVNISLTKPIWKLSNDKSVRLRYFVKRNSMLLLYCCDHHYDLCFTISSLPF